MNMTEKYVPHTPGLDDAINRTVDAVWRPMVYRALIGFKRDVANIVSGRPRELTLLERVQQEQAALTVDDLASRPYSALETDFIVEKARMGWTAKQIARQLPGRAPHLIVQYLGSLGVRLLDLRRESGLGYRNR